jgi:uncharacterized membrane protein YeiH
MITAEHFQLSMRFEFTAVFLFAVTGALVAIEKKYDVVGVLVLAMLSAVGGGLVRDAFFLQRGAPLVLQDERYLYVVGAATLFCLVFGHYLNRFRYFFLLVDALGLGIYAVVGTQRALDMGLHLASASFVGIANAIGGGVLRDVLTGQETLLFRPGEFYVLAAAGGLLVFGALDAWGTLPVNQAAWCSIATTFLIRLASMTFNWRTRAVEPLLSPRERS